MGNNNSPGVYTGEFNISAYAAAQSRSRICVMGGATKGPIGVPTPCYGPGSLLQQFGGPMLTDLGVTSALQVLKTAGVILYLRVAHSDAAAASQDIPGVTGGTPAVSATGTVTLTSNTNPVDAETVTINDGVTTKTFEFDNNNSIVSGHIGVTIGSTARITVTNLITAINNSPLTVIATDTTVSIAQTTLTNSVPGTGGNHAITTSSMPTWAVTGMTGGAAAIAGTTTTLSVFSAATPGSWGNLVYVILQNPSVIPGASGSSFDVSVYAPVNPGDTPTLVERFTNMSFTSSSARFLDTVLAVGIPGEINPSQYILSDTTVAGTPTAAPTTYTLGTGGGTVGNDGLSDIAYTDYIGTLSGRTSKGLVSLANADTVDFNILTIPGNSDYRVIAPAITLAETRGDFLYIVDPPFGLSVLQVVQWHNGLQPDGVPNAPEEPITSNFAELPWPWLQNYDPYNQVSVWIPPSAFHAGLMATVDLLNGPWQPSAGYVWGTVQAQDIEYSPDQSDRDTLNGDNNINPFVAFPQGITMFGNKTFWRIPTVYQSLHVRRLLIYAKKIIVAVVRRLVMSPNNATTQQKFTQLCNAPLSAIASQQGLQQFLVVCDASNNPPSNTPTRTLNGYIILQPEDIAERIVVQFAATSDSTVFSATTISAVGQ